MSKFTPVGMNVTDASLRQLIGDVIATRYNVKYPLLVDDRCIAIVYSEQQIKKFLNDFLLVFL